MLRIPEKIKNTIEKYLRREEKKTKQTMDNLNKEDPFLDPNHVSDNAASDTDAFEQTAHQRIESLQKELVTRLGLIGRALMRLRNGRYGICENCGRSIEKKRLEIMPTATLCVSCERKQER